MTNLPWRVTIGDTTVAAFSTAEDALLCGKLLAADLTDLTISFSVEAA
jgi:hypothetical protein